MNKERFLDKYRFYIGGFLIIVIIAGWVYLFLSKNNSSIENKNSQEISILKSRIDELNSKAETTDGGRVAGVEDVKIDTPNTEENSSKININSASPSELESISGIGPAKAADIIEYREANGGFATISEIQNVKGIGPATFEKMKDQISVE